jgi:hypothetical protein
MSPALLFALAHIHVRGTEGGLVVSSSVYEQGAIEECKAWFQSMGKPYYAVGPLSLPEVNWKNSPPSETEAPVINFMNKMQQRFGEKSLIYVRILLCYSSFSKLIVLFFWH